MNQLQKIQAKQIELHQLPEMAQQLKAEGKKIVFTNGCFDILHKGHLTYLAKAADLGDVLVLGLNSDDSVKRQGKGANRPINDENARSFLLAGLSAVDFVVLFEEDTPLELIRQLSPDVLVKGGDYDVDETDSTSKRYVVGSDWVKQNGGSVICIPLVEGFSTTKIISIINAKK